MIQTNFRADLVAHIDVHLNQLGYRPAAAGDARQKPAPYLMLLIRALRRIPSAQPRRAIQAPGFSVPAPHEAGFQALLRAVEVGQSLRPWLGTRVKKLNKRDELLDDWGIHHFHLGVGPDYRDPAFVARTDEVAFALVRPDAIYFIVATGHNFGTAPLVWTQTELIKIVHRYWPTLIGTPKLPSRVQVLTAEDHARFRERRVNAGVTVSDDTIYYPPGGGVMSNGDGATDYMYQMQLLRRLDYLAAAVQQHEAQIRAGLGVEDRVHLALKARFDIGFPEGFAIKVYHAATNVSISL